MFGQRKQHSQKQQCTHTYTRIMVQKTVKSQHAVWAERLDRTSHISFSHAQEMLWVMLVCKAGQSHHRSCFFSLSLVTPPKGHILFDLPDLLRDPMTQLSRHYYNYSSLEASIYRHHHHHQHHHWTIQWKEEVKGQRETIVMEVCRACCQATRVMCMCVLSNKNRVQTWIQYKIYFMQCFYLQCHSHTVL